MSEQRRSKIAFLSLTFRGPLPVFRVVRYASVHALIVTPSLFIFSKSQPVSTRIWKRLEQNTKAIAGLRTENTALTAMNLEQRTQLDKNTKAIAGLRTDNTALTAMNLELRTQLVKNTSDNKDLHTRVVHLEEYVLSYGHACSLSVCCRSDQQRTAILIAADWSLLLQPSTRRPLTRPTQIWQG